jgi:hypothetical protein
MADVTGGIDKLMSEATGSPSYTPAPRLSNADDEAEFYRKNAEYFKRNSAYAKPGPYITQLDPEAEQEFRSWVKANKIAYNPDDKGNEGYDMRGFWKAMKVKDPRAGTEINAIDHRLHFGDTWKTPYHESFNKESMYSLPTNPNHWVGDMEDPALVGADKQIIIPRRSGKAIDWDYKP